VNSRTVAAPVKTSWRDRPAAAHLRSPDHLLSCSSSFWVQRFLVNSFFGALNGIHVRELARIPKGVDLADETAALTGEFPRGYCFLVDQLNRAALSVATNLAEGNGRFTKADRRNFFVIARGSTQECVPLLEVARRRGFIQDAKHAELRANLEVIAKMISGLINGLENRDV